jgi:hypothetical protein
MFVRNKEIGLLPASKLFEMPKSTLNGKVNSKEQSIETLVNIRIGRKPLLPEALEKALVSYCLFMENNFWPSYQRRQQDGISNHLSGKDKKFEETVT